MWEDYSRKNRITKIILIIIAVILAAGLLIGYKLISSSSSAQQEQLLTASAQSQEQQDAAKAELVAQVEADYQKDMDTVARYLPGIVCWGDKTTAGSAGAVSYPDALQDLIDENICDLYSFRGTLDYTDNLSRIDWTKYTVNIPVVNMGAGEEDTSTILGRAGAVPYVTAEDIIIPAASEPVTIELLSQDGKEVTPLIGADGGVNKVTIAGVEGTLSLDAESYTYQKYSYSFTRSEPGTEVSVPAGEEIVTAASQLYRDYFPIIFIGTYGGYDDLDELIAQQKALVESHIGLSDRYLVIGLYYLQEYSLNDGGYTEIFEQYESAMEKAFGEHFINIRKYLIGDCISDLKLTLDGNDSYLALHGCVPRALRASRSTVELKGEVYKLLAQVIYNRMDQLGYFDEITAELGIDDVIAQMKQNELDAKLNGTTTVSSNGTISSSSSSK